MSEPRSLSLAALAGRSAGFSRDRRYDALPDPADPDPVVMVDPVEHAYARGYAEGAEAGNLAAQAQAAADDAARHRIETALALMDKAQIDAFARRLHDTVLALCESVLGEAAILPDSLTRRVAAAAAMFNRAGDERVIRLHPEDLALVHGRLAESWHCEPDPALERGTVRIETADGGVEDGPGQWRAALAEALRTC